MIAALTMTSGGRSTTRAHHHTDGTTDPMTDPMTHAGITTRTTMTLRSTEMHTMHEALAREHIRRREREARQHSLSSELASANRWRYLERRAHAAYQRHAARAQGAAHLAAAAD